MNIIKIYVAEDGTKFNDEVECLEYEERLKAQKFADVAFLYDAEGERLPMESKSFEETFYMVAKTDEAADFMAELFDGWMIPCDEHKAGCWVFFNECWQPAEDILDVARIIEKIL